MGTLAFLDILVAVCLAIVAIQAHQALAATQDIAEKLARLGIAEFLALAAFLVIAVTQVFLAKKVHQLVYFDTEQKRQQHLDSRLTDICYGTTQRKYQQRKLMSVT